MSENPSCACGRTHCCSCAAQLYDEKIARLEAEVASLRKERDEARGNAERYAADILRVMDQRDEALRQYGTAQDTIDAMTLNDTERVVNAESRLSALTAAASPCMKPLHNVSADATDSYMVLVEFTMGELRRIRALLSGEEGR